MKLKISLTALALAAGVLLGALPGMATGIGPLSAVKDLGAAQSSIIEKTHGWHRTCQWGLNGWHKHVPGVGRVQCTNHKCWTNSFGIRRCRWF
jgi:hypothetical protein